MQLETVDLTDDIRHLKLTGRLDMEGTQAIGDRFAAASTESATKIIVDLAGVSALSSVGIRMLLVSAKTQRNRGGTLVLASPQPFVRKVLEAAGMDQLFGITQDVESARASLGA